jgi:hypothetical protein
MTTASLHACVYRLANMYLFYSFLPSPSPVPSPPPRHRHRSLSACPLHHCPPPPHDLTRPSHRPSEPPMPPFARDVQNKRPTHSFRASRARTSTITIRNVPAPRAAPYAHIHKKGEHHIDTRITTPNRHKKRQHRTDTKKDNTAHQRVRRVAIIIFNSTCMVYNRKSK